MKTLTKNKTTLLTAILLVLLMFAYNMFFGSEALPIPSELTAASIGEDLIKTHIGLQQVSLDQSLFTTPGYLLLIDFSTTIPAQATGRPNPFNAIGQD